MSNVPQDDPEGTLAVLTAKCQKLQQRATFFISKCSEEIVMSQLLMLVDKANTLLIN